MYEALLGETYAVTSYDEMFEAKRQAEESVRKYKQAYKNFLITCLCKAGFAKKRVRFKKLNLEGVLQVEEKSYFSPYEIKFYPVKKDGGLSQKSRYHGNYHDEGLVAELTENFEVVGDENAG